MLSDITSEFYYLSLFFAMLLLIESLLFISHFKEGLLEIFQEAVKIHIHPPTTKEATSCSIL